MTNDAMDIQGYPEELLKDQIKITITDRAGISITKTINVRISNNSIGRRLLRQAWKNKTKL